MYVFNYCACFRVFALGGNCCNFVFAVENCKFNLAVCIRLQFDFGIFAVYGRCNRNTGSTEIIKVKVIFVNAYQRHVTVNTAVKRKVSHLRINVVIRTVVGGDNKQIFVLNAVKFCTEGRVAAVVRHNFLAVKIYLTC